MQHILEGVRNHFCYVKTIYGLMNCIDPVLCNFVLFAQFCLKRNVISLHSFEL